MTDTTGSSTQKAWVITGPTSGFGHRVALELARKGTLVLVGRSQAKLDDVTAEITALGGRAVTVVADFSDIPSVKRAAAEIIALGLPIAGVLNNAGIFPTKPGTAAQGWDLAYTTDHLGPFAFTEALIPHLSDHTNVVFIVSAVEDPERKPAVAAGFRGARYISAEASARGEWRAGGAANPSFDAYATAKQGNLATVLAFARAYPRLRFNAIEPGFAPGSNLGRDANAFLRFITKYVLSPLAPRINYWTTPPIAGRMIAKVLTEPSDVTGGYYNEKGEFMRGSTQVHDPEFQDLVVAETRALLGGGDGSAA